MTLSIAGMGKRGQFLPHCAQRIQEETSIVNAWEDNAAKKNVMRKVHKHVQDILRSFAQAKYLDSEKKPLSLEEVHAQFDALYLEVDKIRANMQSAKFQATMFGSLPVRSSILLVRPISMRSKEGRIRPDLDPIKNELLAMEDALDDISQCMKITVQEIAEKQFQFLKSNVKWLPDDILWIVVECWGEENEH